MFIRFSPQLKYLCMSVYFSKHYLATHTHTGLMYKILSQWSECCFSFSFLSCWQAERTDTQSNTIITFTAPAGAVFKASLCPLSPPMPVKASRAPALGHLPAKTAQSSGQRQQSQAPDLAAPALLWEGHRQPRSPQGWVQEQHPREQHSTPQRLLCTASGARTFPEHTERCLVFPGLRLNPSGTQVAGYTKIWLFLNPPP